MALNQHQEEPIFVRGSSNPTSPSSQRNNETVNGSSHHYSDKMQSTEKTPLRSKEGALVKKYHDQPVEEEAAIVRIVGLKWSIWRAILYYIGCVLSIGILPFFAFWFPKIAAYGRKSRVPLDEAKFVFVKGVDEEWEDVPVEEIPSHHGIIRVFLSRNLRYVWDPEIGKFTRPSFNTALPFTEIRQTMTTGLTSDVVDERKKTYGLNSIEIPIPSVGTLLLREVLHPFYIFQAFSVTLWLIEEYIYYAICVTVMTLVSIIWTVVFTRRNLVKLRAMAKSECDITVHRDGQERQVNSTDLIPGDIVSIREDISMPCDVILFSGEAVMNESMLTGESNPVVKAPIPLTSETYSKTHKKHTLFCGTKVVQLKIAAGDASVRGIVSKTAFSTAKGGLFFSILFPKPIKFQFYTDSYKFLAIMIVVALIGFVWAFILLRAIGNTVKSIMISSLDLITIAVPPALPLILTVGIGFALNRLLKKEIFCISPQRINYAGKVNVMCFDKTGTLTHDDLSVEGVRPVHNAEFLDETHEIDRLQGPLLDGMATTHSISKVNGLFVGHPVDVRMFESTGMDYTDSDHHPAELNGMGSVATISRGDQKRFILRRFEFEPALQRMSTIIVTGGQQTVSVKGSPEAVRALCDPQSIPANFDSVLRDYARKGFYVLGFGYRHIQMDNEAIHTTLRDDIERDLTFAGLLMMENKLKDETPGVIQSLKSAHIRVIMITGDNAHTAITVARKCDLINATNKVFLGEVLKTGDPIVWKDVDTGAEEHNPHQYIDNFSVDYAVTGKAVSQLFIDQQHDILDRVQIFARTSPEQKTQITEHCMAKGDFVGMCGDGTNDCGALKAAHVGLALSEAEASVVSPFTSKRKSIIDVVSLFREGRCALMTSFSAFKYMVLYPLIQLLSATRLYQARSVLGDFQYLWCDLFLVLPLAICMCLTGPYPKLSRRTPTSSLFSPRILISMLVQSLLVIGSVVGLNIWLKQQPWYVPPKKNIDDITDNVVCMDNTVTFLYANFPYVITAIAFSTGKPFRKWIYTNWLFMIAIGVTWTLNVLLLLLPVKSIIKSLFQIDPGVPLSFKIQMLLVAHIHLIIAVVFEYIFVEGFIASWLGKTFSKAKKKKQPAYSKQLQASVSSL